MYGYGIHTTISGDGGGNEALKIQGRRLLYEGPLASLAGGVELDKGSAPAQWRELATAVARELDERGLHPLGLDSPLSLADPGSGGRGRPFESGVQAPFKTPESFDGDWPGGASKTFLKLARLWTEVAYLLVTEHGWTFWAGQARTLGTKILVEVYPRISWATLAAASGTPVDQPYSRVALRDSILEGLQLSGPRKRQLTKDLRDAAVCAVTASNVVARGGGFLGRGVEADKKKRALVGGGIALPWMR
jgi:hypothetical protein